MQFIAQYWWVFLIVTVVCYGLIIGNQLQRMRRIVSLQDTDSIFQGIGFLIVYAVMGTGSGVLFILGAIMAIMQWAKH